MDRENANRKMAKYREPASLHLRGARSIAATFGVSRSTVTAWKEAGSPISQIGKSYQASYQELWSWLKEHENTAFLHL